MYLAGRGQAAVAGQGGPIQRGLGGRLGQPGSPGFQERGALRAVNEAHRHALAQALDLAAHAGLHAGQCGRAVELQDEELLLIDGGVFIGLHAQHPQAPGLEGVAAAALERRALEGLQPGAHLEGAGGGSGQLVGEVKHPFTLTGPTARTLRCRGVPAAQAHRGGCLGVAKIHDILVKLHHHLLHLSDLALGRKTDNLQGLAAHRCQCQKYCEQSFHPMHPARCERLSVADFEQPGHAKIRHGQP